LKKTVKGGVGNSANAEFPRLLKEHNDVISVPYLPHWTR